MFIGMLGSFLSRDYTLTSEFFSEDTGVTLV